MTKRATHAASVQEYKQAVEPLVTNEATGMSFRIRKVTGGELLLDGVARMPDIGDRAAGLRGKSIEEYDEHDVAVAELIATAMIVRGVVSMKLVDKAREDCAENELSARPGQGMDESDRAFLVNAISDFSGFVAAAKGADTVLAPTGAPDDTFRGAEGAANDDGEPHTGGAAD